MKKTASPFERILDLLDEENDSQLRTELAGMRSEDIADAVERISPEQGGQLLGLMSDDLAGQVLVDASDESMRVLLPAISDDTLARILDVLPMDDAADLLEEIGEDRFEQLLGMIPAEDAGEIERLLAYPDASVAREMTEHFFRVRVDNTMAEVLEDLRQAPEEKYETVNDIYVLDDDSRLEGIFSLRKGLRAAQDIPVAELMNRDVVSVSVLESAEDAARRMARYGYYSLPVLEEDGRMVGLFTGDDAQEVIEEADTEDHLRLGAVGGPADSYMSLNVWQLAKRRLPWLGALFVAETFTGAVMRHYGHDERMGLVPLTFFIPLLLGAGGNAGAQVTTTLTRSLALGDVQFKDWFTILRKEALTAILIGGTLGAIGYLRARFGWHTSLDLSLVIALALPAIVFWAAVVGSLLPIGAKRLGIDPAVMSAPVITTFVDATGLVIYFEIARQIVSA
ncbi:MAG: magnesium transporter [Armatimonadetes bacterium]|nr:magnesium transporter [Armatimonadota bacterium]